MRLTPKSVWLIQVVSREWRFRLAACLVRSCSLLEYGTLPKEGIFPSDWFSYR